MRIATLLAAVVLATTVLAQEPAAKTAMGPMPWPTSENYYPAKARRLGITGRVGLECSVDTKARAQNCVVVEPANQMLNDAAKSFFSRAQFRIPADWAATGGPAKRFLYGVVFQLIGKPPVAGFDDGREVVIIQGQ